MTEREFAQQYLGGFHPQQREAVFTTQGPVLLLAVPGSGKTTVLVTRLGFLVLCRQIPPEQITTVTYTTAAAAEMKERFRAMFGEETAQGMEFRTINGISAMVIRRYEETQGRTAFTLVSSEKQISRIISEVWRSCSGKYATENDLRILRTLFTYIKNSMLTAEEIEDLDRQYDMPVSTCYRQYVQTLRESGLMDYDDQMVYALSILRRHPAILDHFRDRCRWLCVDEAQDTSRIQHELIRLLAGKDPNLFMVGDEDQSIYGFRAAWPDALLRFEKIYPGARVLLMEENYRSAPQIVQAADAFIRKNLYRHEKTMQPVRSGTGQVTALILPDRKSQYAVLLDRFGRPETETAILYRDNECALPLVHLLERSGIPFSIRGADPSFFSHPVVQDLLQVLQFAQDPFDTDLFLSLYYRFGIPISREQAQEAAASSDRTGRPVLTELEKASYGWKREQIRQLQRSFGQLLRDPADRAVSRILHEMGYLDFLLERKMDDRKAFLLQMIGTGIPDISSLQKRLSDLRELTAQGRDDPGAKLILSTIHSSKGLEYPAVVLMDCADGIFPRDVTGAGSSGEERRAFEEERRLFYVGMTRARDSLTVLCYETSPSCLTADLFPKKKAAGPAGRKRRPAGSRKQADAGEHSEYAAGITLRHRAFGAGTVTQRKRDTITVRFDEYGEKKISLGTALERDLMEITGDREKK